MRVYNWTDEQLNAIETAGVPIIVSAAAGSGKTAVLVERTIRLLCDESKGIPADTLLAVTFTNDAAAQMSRKLSAEIDIRAEKEPENRWIQRQQALLRLAEITTINSFCYGLVKDNLSETPFHSGLRIMEENEAAMLTDRALTAVLENEYAERPEETEELISLFCRENDAALRKIILSLNRFLRSIPFPELWAANAVSRLRNGDAVEELLEDIKNEVKEKAEIILSTVSRLRYCAVGLEYHSAAREVLFENCDFAESLIEALSQIPPEAIKDTLVDVAWKPLTVRQTKAEKESSSELEAQLYESAKSCYAHLKGLFSELAETYSFTEEEVTGDAFRVADYFEKLFAICKRLDEEVMRVKVERNAVDFADTELMCVKLLVNCNEIGVLTRTPLAEEIVSSHRYRVILIDEFQDVNNLQEVIFKAISDTESLEEIGRNVFVVGDVKQAIYRFRQANPLIFMKTRAQGKSEDSGVCELLLRKNFRSRGSVLDFCNYIFGALMSERVGETEYTDEEALVQGSDFESPDSPTEIILLDCDDEDAEELEFSAVASRIRQMIDAGQPVKTEEGFRPCRPSDFCVLTRNNVSGQKILKIFADEGLKILSSDTSGYLKSREISVLLNLLAIISNPMQDIPLASVMLSPIVGFTDDELAKIRLISRADKLYKTVLRISKEEFQADTSIKDKCCELTALLKRLSILASGLTLTRLIRKIYDITDIVSIASAYEDGAQKCANLYLLLEYARSYEQSSPDGIAGFLRYIDYISKSGGDFEQALTVTESDEAVVIKTIHRSKGLEFPFVFLCRTRKKFNQSDLHGALQLNGEKGVGLSFLDYDTLTKRQTSFWKRVRNANKSELLSEELRLLYVAMTRAKERLFILLDVSDSAIKRAAELSYEIDGYRISPAVAEKAACPADWLLLGLIKHPQLSSLREKIGTGIYFDEKAPRITLSAPSGRGERIAAREPDIAFDRSLYEKLTDSFKLAGESLCIQGEAKLSVSEIVRDDALSFFPRVPDLDESLEEFSAAQRGTITHRFMQYCDFEGAAQNLEGEIRRLADNSVFTEREAEVIDRRSVSRFFKSDIYLRLKQSANVLRERSFIVKFSDIKVDKALAEIYNGTDGMLQGIADCLFEETDGYVLVDYKTDRVHSTAELSERYSGQLALYKAAFDAILDKPVKSSYIYSFRLGEGIELML